MQTHQQVYYKMIHSSFVEHTKGNRHITVYLGENYLIFDESW